MKGIMFNTKYGLEQAVLLGNKTRTFRADKKPRYEVGEIVAIKQSYKQLITEQPKEWLYEKGLMANLPIEGEIVPLAYLRSAGYNNKMFVRHDLMPHHIRITAIKPCHLQDITDEECLREGIIYLGDIDKFYFQREDKEGFYFSRPKDAFAKLIDKLNGKGFWNTNPHGYAYEFELVKRL